MCTRKNRLAEAVLTSTRNLCFEQKYEKYQSILPKKKNRFLEVKFSIYLNRRVFVMKNVADPAGIEPATSRSLVGHRSIWTIEDATLADFAVSKVWMSINGLKPPHTHLTITSALINYSETKILWKYRTEKQKIADLVWLSILIRNNKNCFNGHRCASNFISLNIIALSLVLLNKLRYHAHF